MWISPRPFRSHTRGTRWRSGLSPAAAFGFHLPSCCVLSENVRAPQATLTRRPARDFTKNIGRSSWLDSRRTGRWFLGLSSARSLSHLPRRDKKKKRSPPPTLPRTRSVSGCAGFFHDLFFPVCGRGGGYASTHSDLFMFVSCGVGFPRSGPFLFSGRAAL
jgi:hypothetical protein